MIFFFDKKESKKGQAMIIGIMFLLFSSLILVFGISAPLLAEIRVLGNLKKSNASFFAAEGAMEDATLRLKKGQPIADLSNLSLNGANVLTTVTDSLGGKEILSEGVSLLHTRRLKTSLALGDGVAFHYGIQTGKGGFSLGGNAGVYGNVYSNGSIVGENGAFITGSVLVANASSISADQSNISPTPPVRGVIFGRYSSEEDLAQSFISSGGPISRVNLMLKKVGTPANINVSIRADNSGTPSSTIIDSTTLSSSLITSEFGFVEAIFSGNTELVSGERYWLTLDVVSNSNKYYEWAVNDAYVSGELVRGRTPTSFSVVSPVSDGYFEIYFGGETSLIENIIVGQNGEGDAHAHTVNNSTITGSLYCKVGSGNNQPCDTSREDPGARPYPVSDANIDSWKSDASSGGISGGDVIIDGNSNTLGPVKIDGNMTITTGSGFVLEGTIWLTGNLIMENNSSISVSPAYGEAGGILIVDGYVDLNNNVAFYGSGTPGSYLLLLSTSDCPESPSCESRYAIDVENNVTTVILNAQKGTIRFANNAGASAATAETLRLDNNATIIYETGLSDTSFTSGPSGGYEIQYWTEVE